MLHSGGYIPPPTKSAFENLISHAEIATESRLLRESSRIQEMRYADFDAEKSGFAAKPPQKLVFSEYLNALLVKYEELDNIGVRDTGDIQ